MGVSGQFAMYFRTAQLFHRDLLAEHGFNYFRTRDEHLRDIFNYEYEVGQRRRVNGATCTRSENDRYLRNHTARKRIPEKYFAVTGQCVHALLNTGSTRVVDTDQRNTHIQCIVHDFGDLAGVHETERTAGDRKVLCEDRNRLSANHSGTDNHSVARERFVLHTEIPTVMFYENIVFMERVFIQQSDDPLASREFSHRFLFLYGLCSASKIDFFFSMLKFENFFILYRHCSIQFS